MDAQQLQLTEEQIKQYQDQGCLILRGAIREDEIQRLESGLSRARPVDKTLEPSAPTFPEPGRYTYASQCPADPDLAFIIEHPAMVEPATQLLGDEPRLSAYVLYDRWPGGPGIPAHHDYKRWRPVGSSMNWLFTVVPFTDFDQTVGALEVAPGSHRLERITPGSTPCLEVAPAIRPAEADFIDPELKRGDLLFMNMHLWHRAPTNTSDIHRVGLFNKYAGASTPPATGWYRYESSLVEALSEEGRRLIAVSGDPDIARTRAVLTREHHDDLEVLCLPSTDGTWTLPGGKAEEDQSIADWDLGNVIGSLQHHLREQIGGETPWVSFIDDFSEPEGVSRVYGYQVAQGRLAGPTVGNWLPVSTLRDNAFEFEWIPDAVESWLDPSVVRGKGLAQSQARVDQFAY